MATQTSPAIIINRYDFKENDVLVYLYSENFGKLKLLARGAKKFNSKLAAHIEPISLSEILVIPGKAFNYLAAANTKKHFFSIKNSWQKIQVAGQILNIFNKTIKENEVDQKLYLGLINCLERLEESKEEASQTCLALWMIRFLDLLGYRPNLSNCQSCQNNLIAGEQTFNLNLGGLICSSCKKNFPQTELYKISENCVKLLRFLINNQETLIVKKSLIKELNDFLFDFWRYQQN